MDAGLVAALAADRAAGLAALEVDEMHVPHVSDAVDPSAIVLLNLSRDQLDRVGEINVIERTLRSGLARHPDAVVVANCDDVLMTSAAYDSPNVVWVAAGGTWSNDSVSCPRSGEVIVRDAGHWYSTGADFKRPSPHWWFDDDTLYGPDGLALPMRLALPGAVNRGNAAQAVAAAVALGADPGCRSRGGLRRRRSRRALPDGARRPARRADPAGQEPGRLAGSAVDGEQARGRGGHRRQRAGARRRGPVLAVGRAVRALRGNGRRRRRRTRHRPGGAAGVRGRRAHAGARHPRRHRLLPAGARRGGRQLHRVPAAAAGPWSGMADSRQCGSAWCCPT